HRQIGGLFTLEYLSGVDTDKSICIRYIGAITDQPARNSKITILVDRRNGVLERHCSELLAATIKESIGSDYERACLQLLETFEGRIDLVRGASTYHVKLESKTAGCHLSVSLRILAIAIVRVDEQRNGGNRRE